MNCYVKNGQVRKIVHHGAPRPDILSPWRQLLSLPSHKVPIPCLQPENLYSGASRKPVDDSVTTNTKYQSTKEPTPEIGDGLEHSGAWG